MLFIDTHTRVCVCTVYIINVTILKRNTKPRAKIVPTVSTSSFTAFTEKQRKEIFKDRSCA